MPLHSALLKAPIVYVPGCVPLDSYQDFDVNLMGQSILRQTDRFRDLSSGDLHVPQLADFLTLYALRLCDIHNVPTFGWG
jgi:hypothetical protein